jgi:hypothetical protein
MALLVWRIINKTFFQKPHHSGTLKSEEEKRSKTELFSTPTSFLPNPPQKRGYPQKMI